MQSLEKIVKQFLEKEYKIPCITSDEADSTEAGVWVAPTSADEEKRKIASHWITSHGLAINLQDQCLPYFQAIAPCGVANRPMTSVETELRKRSPEAPPNVSFSEETAGRFKDVFFEFMSREAGFNLRVFEN